MNNDRLSSLSDLFGVFVDAAHNQRGKGIQDDSLQLIHDHRMYIRHSLHSVDDCHSSRGKRNHCAQTIRTHFTKVITPRIY